MSSIKNIDYVYSVESFLNNLTVLLLTTYGYHIYCWMNIY